MGARSMSLIPHNFSTHLFFFFLCLCLSTQLSMAADRISPGQSLSGNQTIVSKGGIFALGFFSPGNSTKYYLGIWYQKISVENVVWVANRETPLPDNKSSQAKISDDGSLVLVNHTNIPVWSTNSTVRSLNSTVAILQDNGNLVLVDGSNSSAIIWQSFDHPAHVWLPTGRLGFNNITGVNQRLISWRSMEDPAPGPFNLELDPVQLNQYIILWNRTRRYWSSGAWDGTIFSDVPEMRQNYIYNFRFEPTERGPYFYYDVKDNTTISRFVMDLSGQIIQESWSENLQEWRLFWSQPRARCSVYSLCGAFGMCNERGQTSCRCLQGFEPRLPKQYMNLSDWSGGCVRKTRLQCQSNNSANINEDKFLPMSNMRLPENGTSLAVSSMEECQLACLNDCSCSAYAYNGGCSIWRGNLMNLQEITDDSSGRDLYVRLAASELASPSSKKGKVTGIVVGVVVGVVVVLGMIILVIWRCKRKQRMVSLKATEGSLVPFSYRDLQIITKNFSEKLGGGSFGSVFKGILPDSTSVAVKKLEGPRQGEKQFRTEVSTIGTVQHVNLIRLRGFCSEANWRLLVYDYMPNGSLDSHLFNKESATLDWKTRFQIALGTARGLEYLHEKCRECIIHCDIKPENILLDSTFCAKVADFGLAKLLGREFSRVLTTMRGTRGYLAPEWISGLAISAKADVFSYGMMLFELISGKRNSQQSEDGRTFFFPTWAAQKLIEGDVLSLLDSKLLESSFDMDELVRASRAACWCMQDDENERPSMGQIVKILEGVLEVNVPPIPRCLQILAGQPATLFSHTHSSAHSSRPLSKSSNTSQAKSLLSTSSND